MKVAGVVLCGGKSTRMGRAKATLPFGPETMLQRVVRLLRPVVDPIVVVAAQNQELPELDDVLLTCDESHDRGPLEGIRAGLAILPKGIAAAYVTSCDVPLLQADFVSHLVGQLDDHEIVVPIDGKFHHPLAAVYRPTVVPVIEQLLAADQLRPFFLFDRVATRRVPVDELRAVDAQLDTLANLNQPADYHDALSRAGF